MSLVKEIMKYRDRFNPTPLEKKQLGERAKKGEKTPPVPKREKKTRTAEFKFDEGGFWYPGYKPGQVIQFNGTPPHREAWDNDQSKIAFALGIIRAKHGVMINQTYLTTGDYTEFHSPGEEIVIIDNTFMAIVDAGGLVSELERAFRLDPTMRTIKKEEKNDTRTAAEKWADDWENRNKVPPTEDSRDESTPDTEASGLGYHT